MLTLLSYVKLPLNSGFFPNNTKIFMSLNGPNEKPLILAITRQTRPIIILAKTVRIGLDILVWPDETIISLNWSYEALEYLLSAFFIFVLAYDKYNLLNVKHKITLMTRERYGFT